MANWVAKRNGNWTRASNNADSPWYDGGTQTALSTYPGVSDDVDLVSYAVTLDATGKSCKSLQNSLGGYLYITATRTFTTTNGMTESGKVAGTPGIFWAKGGNPNVKITVTINSDLYYTNTVETEAAPLFTSENVTGSITGTVYWAEGSVSNENPGIYIKNSNWTLSHGMTALNVGMFTFVQFHPNSGMLPSTFTVNGDVTMTCRSNLTLGEGTAMVYGIMIYITEEPYAANEADVFKVNGNVSLSGACAIATSQTTKSLVHITGNLSGVGGNNGVEYYPALWLVSGQLLVEGTVSGNDQEGASNETYFTYWSGEAILLWEEIEWGVPNCCSIVGAVTGDILNYHGFCHLYSGTSGTICCIQTSDYRDGVAWVNGSATAASGNQGKIVTTPSVDAVLTGSENYFGVNLASHGNYMAPNSHNVVHIGAGHYGVSGASDGDYYAPNISGTEAPVSTIGYGVTYGVDNATAGTGALTITNVQTALTNQGYTETLATNIETTNTRVDTTVSSRHASGAAVAKSPATVDWSNDVTNKPTIGTSTLTQSQVTGGAYSLQTDTNGYLKLSVGTGTGQVSVSSGVVSASGNWLTYNDSVIRLMTELCYATVKFVTINSGSGTTYVLSVAVPTTTRGNISTSSGTKHATIKSVSSDGLTLTLHSTLGTISTPTTASIFVFQSAFGDDAIGPDSIASNAMASSKFASDTKALWFSDTAIASAVRTNLTTELANLDAKVSEVPSAAEIATSVWSVTLSAMDGLGITTVGKWFRILFNGITTLLQPLTAQQTRDAMKLAPSSGGASTGSIDSLLENVGLNEEQAAQLEAAAASSIGQGSQAVQITCSISSTPLDGVACWITTDAAGANVVAGTVYSDALGHASFMLDPGGYFLWRQLSGYNFTNPQPLTVT